MGTKSVSVEVKWQVIGLWKTNKTYRDIAEQLKISKTYVQQVQETVVDLLRSGRPRKTSMRQDRAIIKVSKLNQSASLPDIATEVAQNHGIQVSTATLSRRLKESGMESHFALAKPPSSAVHKLKCQFCKQTKNWLKEA
ncbi:uncharacterized protein LOC142331651 [Lycorma delicatula]|uniref:uncharacterized protein LOC142331651 n=1 Tax=Lycorma delicatula TaxID=130591 RepID=UPI003F515B10